MIKIDKYMKFIIFITLFTVLSCTKQSPDDISSTHRRADLTENKSCNDVVFLKQAITKENLLKFLECTKWDQEYPDLKNGLIAFNPEEFDYISSPLNKAFFESKSNRARYFDLFKIFNSVDGTGYNSIDYYLKNLIPRWSEVGSSYFKRAQKVDSLKFLENIVLSEENLKKEIVSFAMIQKYLLLNDKFRISLAKSFKNTKTIYKIKDFLEIALKTSPRNLKIINKVLWAQNGAVVAIAGDKNLTLSEFSKFVVSNKKTIQDSGKMFESLYDKKLQCPVSSSNKYYINPHDYVWKEINRFKDGNVLRFRSKLTEISHRLPLTASLCPNEELLEIIPTANKAIVTINDFCKKGNQCLLFKNILSQFTEEEIKSFYNFLASEEFNKLTALLDYLNSEETELMANLDNALNTIGLDFIDAFKLAYSESANTILGTLLEVITTFDNEELKKGSDLLSHFLIKKDLVKQVNPFFLEVFLKFPDLTINYLNLYKTNKDLFYQSVISFLDLNKGSALEDFVSFLSTNSLLKLYKQLIGPALSNAETLNLIALKFDAFNPINTPDDLESINSKCLIRLKESGYYLDNLVLAYPKECTESESGFAHLFVKEVSLLNDQNSSSSLITALVQPDLLAQLVSMTSNYYSNKENKNLISENIVSILPVLKKVNIGNLMDQFLNSKNAESWGNFLKDKENQNQLEPLLKSLKSPTVNKYLSRSMRRCDKLDKDVGSKTCLSQKEFQLWLVNFNKILFRKNGSGKSALKSLLNLFYKDRGVWVPNTIKEKKINISIKDFIGFFHVLSEEDKNFDYILYQNINNERAVKLSIIEQIEVLLRDISFYNNYFGAYFKNQVADSANYVRAVKSMKWRFDNFSWMLTLLNYVPPEYERSMKNSTRTFNSLLRLDEEFKVGAETIQFGTMTHGILTALVESSKENTLSIGITSKPQDEKVIGHNGVFLTELAKVGGLFRIGEYFRSRIPDLGALYSHPEFQLINEKLLSKFAPDDISNFAEFVLETAESKVFINNLYRLIDIKKDDTFFNLERLVANILYMIANSNLNSKELSLVLEHGKSFLRTLSLKELNFEKMNNAIAKLTSITDKIKQDKDISNVLIKLVHATTAPNDYLLVLNLLEQEMDLTGFVELIEKGLDVEALSSYLITISQNKYLIEKLPNEFEQSLNQINIKDGFDFNTHINNIINDIYSSFEISK